MKKKGFTLIELLVVIAIIAMLLAILMPALNKVKKIAQRVICGTNLKGLGNAHMVYANDYDDEFVVQGGGWGTALQWADNCGTEGWRRSMNPSGGLAAGSRNAITVGASLYLLVREADVSPKSFVCPAGSETEFSGRNTGDSGTPFDIVDLYDFGHPTDSSAGPAEGPTRTVSYAYHNPYNAGLATPTGAKSRYSATGSRSASFAVMADKNPWFDNKLPTKGGPTADNYMDIVGMLGVSKTDGDWGTPPATLLKFEKDCANAQPHGREGQNVLYADGHSAYETRTDVSTRNDNIYTPWDYTPGSTMPSAQKTWRRGIYNQSRNTFYPRSTDDSVLVNDHKPTLTDLSE
jgi:prepilin-type N-terminal cleavage/methylation domain-containing protein/prepilin-type processing-associated H-X9-DG protein